MSGSEKSPAVALALSPHHCGKGVKITWLPIAEEDVRVYSLCSAIAAPRVSPDGHMT